MLRLVRSAVSGLLADAIDVTTSGDHTGILGTVWIGLFKAWGGYSPTMLMASLTPANYAGYARQAVVWGTPYIGANGLPAVLAGLLSFVPTDGVTPNTILGAFVADALTGGNLIGVDAFENPVPLIDAASHMAYLLEGVFDYGWTFGSSVVVS
jgi:hypothetical protein